MRKVLEITPALHAAVYDHAHNARCKVKDLAVVLVAYALEHLPEALHEADRLLTYWETAEPPKPTLHIVRVTTPQRD